MKRDYEGMKRCSSGCHVTTCLWGGSSTSASYATVRSPFFCVAAIRTAHELKKVPPVCVSLSAGAHMTEAAAADYRFSCGGGAPSHSFILSFSLRSINLFRAPGCQLIVSAAFSSSSQLSFFMLLVLSCHTVASLFTAAWRHTRSLC